MESKLAAIMAVDVVGFTGLVSRDETGTLARLETLQREVIGLQVGAHRGRVFKSLGDGCLAEFSSTTEAVNCAIGIQKASAVQLRSDEAGEPLLLRIGVSLGDVFIKGDDLLGDGVNKASRLESMAEAGGIAVSEEIMSQIRGKIDLPLEDCGYKRLKSTDAPIHVYMTRSRPGGSGAFLDFGEDEIAGKPITGGCLCGAVRFEIDAPPISTGYCHCRICQKFTGSAMSTWTAFPASALKFLAGGPRYFASSPIAERGFCPTCGASLVYRLLKPREAAYLVVFTASLDDPENHAPAAHSGIESQLPWIDIMDDLPRTRTHESRVLVEAWTSVGLPDPDAWGPQARPPKVF